MSKQQPAAAGYPQQNQTIVEDIASSGRISSTKPIKCRRHSQQRQDILNETNQMLQTQPAATGYPQQNQSNVEDTTSSSRISSTKPNNCRRHNQQRQDILNKTNQMLKTQPAAAGYPQQNQSDVEATASSSRISSTKPIKCRRHSQQRQDILNKTKQMSKTQPAAAGYPQQNQINVEDTANSSRISSTKPKKKKKCQRHSQQKQDILKKKKNVEDTASSSRISSTKPNKCHGHSEQQQGILNKTKQMSKTLPAAAGYPQQNQTNVEDTASSSRISLIKPNKCRRNSQQQQDILNKTKQLSKQPAAAGYPQQKPIKCRRHSQQRQDILNETNQMSKTQPAAAGYPQKNEQMSKTQPAAAGHPQRNQTNVEATASSSRISSTKPNNCRRHSQQRQDILNKTNQMSKKQPAAAGYPQRNQSNVEDAASSSRISSTKPVKCRRHNQQQQDILNKTKQLSKT